MFFRKFGYAFRGIGKALHEETTFRVMLICFVLVIAAALLLGVSAQEWIVLLLCCGAVLCAELINTAIERAVDLASPKQHPLAGKAKDIAAGAVLMISLFAAAAGLIIFIPHLISLLAN